MPMKNQTRLVGLVLVLCIWQSNAAALRAGNTTAANKQATGLLCREVGPNNDDVDVVLEEGGRRSLLFSTNVKDAKGTVMGREVAGMQSTVHCASEVASPKGRQCLPADLSKPVPSCTEVGQIGNCNCAPTVNEPLKLPYQQQLAGKVLKLCEAKAKAKQPFRVLMFGLGGGAVPMYVRHNCKSPLLEIESVESDARVALIAQRLLGFKADSQNKVEIADGEEAATRHAKTQGFKGGAERPFDVVIVDCFDGIHSHVAASCRSERFLHAIHSALGPDGTVLHNVMDTDMKQILPMYQATFGATWTTQEPVQNGQFLIVAKTHSSHPRHA